MTLVTRSCKAPKTKKHTNIPIDAPTNFKMSLFNAMFCGLIVLSVLKDNFGCVSERQIFLVCISCETGEVGLTIL